MSVMPLTFNVLNATADDWESLAQIHSQVNQYWQVVEASVCAGEMFRLVSEGLFEVMPRPPLDIGSILAERLKYWFRMTPAGREEWQRLATPKYKPHANQPPYRGPGTRH